MLKIFLTGDNHIGLKYASHEKSSVIISKRTGAFSDMVSAANKEGCGLFVIAGDLFENTRGVPKKDIAKYLKKAMEQYLPTVKLQDLEQPERASVRGKGEIHE